MPDLDFMFIADYVREEHGKLHALGAGVDSVNVPAVPATGQLGIAIRLLLSRSECGRDHDLELIVMTEDGKRTAELRSRFNVPFPTDPTFPPHWSVAALLAMNLPLTFPIAGIYSMELVVNNSSKKSLSFRVITGQTPQLPAAPQA